MIFQIDVLGDQMHLRQTLGNSGNFLIAFSRGSQIIISNAAEHHSKLLTRSLKHLSTWRYTKSLGPTPYLDQVDLVLSTQGFHQLDVHWLVAVGCKGAKVGLAPAIKNKGHQGQPNRQEEDVQVESRCLISDKNG